MSDAAEAQGRLLRVLMIHADGNLFNNPSLKCLADLFLQNGCEIDFRYPKSHAPMSPIRGLYLLPFGKWIWRFKSIIFNRLCFYPFVFLSVLVEKIFLYKKYDLVIAIDRQGLIEASVLHKITKTPYVLISFEIMFESETSARCKRLEQRASKDVAFWVVQDEERAEQLARENSLQPDNKFLLPLASAGSGMLERAGLRDSLGIPPGKRVAILMGSVSDWSMASEILESVRSWPEDWVLIVHERYGRTSESLQGLLRGMQDVIGRKVFVSNAATDLVDDMGSILSGVSVGLAFYKPVFLGPYLGKNLIHLGLASGKICTCLRYGVPVMMNEIGLYAEEASKYQFGCAVRSPADIPERLPQFSDPNYGENAKKYFSNKLDFNIYRDEIWTKLQNAALKVNT